VVETALIEIHSNSFTGTELRTFSVQMLRPRRGTTQKAR